MARILFVVPPFTGHINPTISLGVSLMGKGHDVAWFGTGEVLRNNVPPEGRCFLLENLSDEHNISLLKVVLVTLQQVQNKQGPESIKLLYEAVLVPLAKCMRPALKKLIQIFSPQLIINDQQAFMGAICAFESEIPYITSVTAPEAIQEFSGLPKIMQWEASQIIDLQKECGIDINRKITCSDLLTLVFTSIELMGSDDFPNHYKFVGPAIKHRETLNDFDWTKLHSSPRPSVLVTLGTFIDQLKIPFFSKVVQAFKDQLVTVIVVAEPSMFDDWPPNFIISPTIPQIQLLKHIDAVICHGGHNTVCETLWHGLPLLVLPYAVDQFNVASQVVRAGCGIRLRHSRLTVEDLRLSLMEIISNDQFKQSANMIADSFKKAGGTDEAVRLIESVLLLQKIEVKEKTLKEVQ